MKRYTELFRYRLKDIDKLHREHCNEGLLWRLYWLFPQLLALMAAATIFYGAYHFEWFSPDIGEFFKDALLTATAAFLLTSAVLSFFAILLSSRHRLDDLERAGIEVAVREEPSIRELWTTRHELRQHRLKNHIAWQLARYLGASLVSAGLTLLLYLLPGSTYPEQTQGHQVINAVVICGVVGGYTLFAIEYLYLFRLWKSIHAPETDDLSSFRISSRS